MQFKALFTERVLDVDVDMDMDVDKFSYLLIGSTYFFSLSKGPRTFTWLPLEDQIFKFGKLLILLSFAFVTFGKQKVK